MTGDLPRPLSTTVDLAVVGAGPAGVAAASIASSLGARVVLVDRARFPRDKCCGDGLTTSALRHLERLGLEVRTIPSFLEVGELVLRSSSGRLASLPLGKSDGLAAAVCRRIELDAAMVALASRRGATVIDGDAFVGIEEGEQALELQLQSGRRIEADAVIAADGAWSTVRRALGDGGSERGAPQHWHAYRTYVSNVAPGADRQLLVSFEDDLLPGYAWSFPLAGGYANVGICVTRDTRRRGAELRQLCEATLRGPFLSSFLGASARIAGPLRSWPIPAPLGSLPLSASAGRVLFVGDAARAADPFSGEGIAQALETGIAAAEAVLSSSTPLARAAAYEHRLASTLAPDQSLAARCNRLMQRQMSNRAAVYLAGQNEAMARKIGRWLYEDYPRSLVFSPRRWRKGLLSVPLPYQGVPIAQPVMPTESGDADWTVMPTGQ